VPLKKSDVVTLRLSCWFPQPVLADLGLYRWLEKPDLVLSPKILQAPQATGPRLVAPPGLRPIGGEAEKAAAAGAAAPPAGRIQAKPIQATKAQPQAAQAQAPARELGPVFQLPKFDIARIRKIALDGAHWMMTPPRTVTLIHAVQQPLGRPGAKAFGVLRGLGDTHAVFDAELDVHGSSSQKFDLDAVWKEPVDDVREKTWRTLDGAAHVLEQPLERGLTAFAMTARTNHRHEFGDTKYRRVTYELTETTRFREQMPEEIAADVGLLVRRSDPITVDVPNAAPPAMPRIVYIVPTFGWERKRQPGKFSSLRKGGGLRVYLERPWFSSGDGELLGVILPPTPGVATGPAPQATANLRTSGGARAVQARPKVQARAAAMTAALAAPAVPEALRPYVTLWGLDPLWRAGAIATPEYPLPGDFAQAEEVRGGLVVPDLPGVASFTAVGHKVEFDEGRGLWFCDIDIDPHGAYFPFVRLALARFQPISVPGAHLSKVVTADFIQLAPDRTVSVAFKLPSLKEITITVGGASYVQAAAGSGPGEIEVALETRSLTLPPEIGWTEVPNTATVLKAQRVAGAEPGTFLWAGKMALPSDLKLKAYRVAVREYETFMSDEPDRTARATLAANVALKRVRRLVFAETFPLVDL
jgi:hypothetical protein